MPSNPIITAPSTGYSGGGDVFFTGTCGTDGSTIQLRNSTSVLESDTCTSGAFGFEHIFTPGSYLHINAYDVPAALASTDITLSITSYVPPTDFYAGIGTYISTNLPIALVPIIGVVLVFAFIRWITSAVKKHTK